MKSHENELSKLREEFQGVPLDHVRLEFVFSLLRSHKFIDPFFVPSKYSIYGDKNQKGLRCVWKRPEEFMQGSIEVFQNSIDQSDINQGKLGNCWFMCALCALTDRNNLIARLFETNRTNSAGIYRVRLCKNGEWQSVTIDDLIPCDSSTNKPVFSENNGPELWVVLLEKAYAKLHGSYLALKGGFAAEAFMDLTGAPAFSYFFKDYEDEVESLVFWNWMVTWHNQGYCLTAATDDGVDEDSGMVPGHYYSITRVEYAQGHYLINLRNPWGSFEWEGPYSDFSREWTQGLKAELRPKFDKHDGAFWMNVYDFFRCFSRVVVGKVGFPYEMRMRNLITKDREVGAIAKEYYSVSVAQRCQVVVGLHQEDERSVGVEEYRRYLDLGIVVLKNQYGSYCFYSASPNNITDRDSQLEVNLEPGEYIIVPISSGCSLQVPQNARPPHFNFVTEEGVLHPTIQSTVRDVFRRFDMDMNQVLGPQEFISFAHRLGQSISEADFWRVICNKYTSTEQGITLQGLYELFTVGVEDKGQDQVAQWLEQLGYLHLYSVESRAVVLSIHHSSPLECSRHHMDPFLNELAWGAAVQHLGETVSSRGGVTLYSFKHTAGCSFVASNSGSSKALTKIDLRDSRNVEFGVKSGVNEKEVPPGGSKVLEHIQCKKDQTKYSWSVSLQVRK